ncbi:MAG: hypothetical protein ACLR43_08875 [Faecalibacillus faecis]
MDKYTKSCKRILISFSYVFNSIKFRNNSPTIGLIRSGLMNLNQAVGIIMGANIGTVITSVLVG